MKFDPDNVNAPHTRREMGLPQKDHPFESFDDLIKEVEFGEFHQGGKYVEMRFRFLKSVLKSFGVPEIDAEYLTLTLATGKIKCANALRQYQNKMKELS